MFSKESRYRNSGVIVTVDARGRSPESARLRPPAEADGTFRHTVDENERLDHLAYKYYRKSQKWWRICDANPGFKSPLALLGKEPVVITAFTVSYRPGDVSEPPWHRLVNTLSGLTGVGDVMLTEELYPVPEQRECEVETGTGPGTVIVTVQADKYVTVITVTHNKSNIGAGELANVIKNEGFTVDETKTVGRVGKQIVIPPDGNE